MPRKNKTLATVQNIFELYKKQFNLANMYQIRLGDARLGVTVGIIKIMDGGGWQVMHRYVSTLEMMYRLSESMITNQPLFY